MLLLSVLFCMTAVVESIGAYSIYTQKMYSSFYYHYVYTFFEYNIIGFIYLQIVKGKFKRKAIKVLCILYSISCFLVLINKYYLFYIIIFGAINTSVFSFFYFSELLSSDKILNYKKLLPFWVSVGFLIFNLTSVPFFLIAKYLKDRSHFDVIQTLIIVMNFIIVFGLLYGRTEYKVRKYYSD